MTKTLDHTPTSQESRRNESHEVKMDCKGHEELCIHGGSRGPMGSERPVGLNGFKWGHYVTDYMEAMR